MDNEISINFGQDKRRLTSFASKFKRKNINTPSLKMWIYTNQRTFYRMFHG